MCRGLNTIQDHSIQDMKRDTAKPIVSRPFGNVVYFNEKNLDPYPDFWVTTKVSLQIIPL